MVRWPNQRGVPPGCQSSKWHPAAANDCNVSRKTLSSTTQVIPDGHDRLRRPPYADRGLRIPPWTCVSNEFRPANHAGQVWDDDHIERRLIGTTSAQQGLSRGVRVRGWFRPASLEQNQSKPVCTRNDGFRTGQISFATNPGRKHHQQQVSHGASQRLHPAFTSGSSTSGYGEPEPCPSGLQPTAEIGHDGPANHG